MNLKKTHNLLFYLNFFLSFLGFYVVLLVVFNIGQGDFSRQLTIPMRMMIGLSSLLIFFLNIRNKSPYLNWFFFFVVIYSIRIIIDYNAFKYFYLPYAELIFFFLRLLKCHGCFSIILILSDPTGKSAKSFRHSSRSDIR